MPSANPPKLPSQQIDTTATKRPLSVSSSSSHSIIKLQSNKQIPEQINDSNNSADGTDEENEHTKQIKEKIQTKQLDRKNDR